MWILTPVIAVVNKLSLGVLMLMKVDPNKRQEMITEDELRTIVEVSHEEGVIDFDKTTAFSIPDSARVLTLILFTVVSAVSRLLESFRRHTITKEDVLYIERYTAVYLS